MMKTTLLLSVVAGLLGVQVSSAKGGRVVPVQELIDRADLILVGRVISGKMTITGGPATVSIRTERVLTGGVEPGTLVNATWVAPPPSRMPPYSRSVDLPKDYGMWFLALGDGGSWRVLPADEGFVPFNYLFFPVPPGPLPEAYSYSEDASTLDKVVSEIGWAIEDSEGDYRGSPPRVLAAHRTLDSSALIPLYQRFAQSASPKLRGFALAGLVKQGSTAALLQFENELDDLVGAPYAGMVAEAISMFFRTSDPLAVQALGRLANGKEAAFNLPNAALYALRNIGTSDCLPYFVQLLDSNDPAMRYDAMAGLAAFVNFGHIPLSERLKSKGQPMTATPGPLATGETLANFPTVESFREDESRYTTFWRDWWERNKSGLTN